MNKMRSGRVTSPAVLHSSARGDIRIGERPCPVTRSHYYHVLIYISFQKERNVKKIELMCFNIKKKIRAV